LPAKHGPLKHKANTADSQANKQNRQTEQDLKPPLCKHPTPNSTFMQHTLQQSKAYKPNMQAMHPARGKSKKCIGKQMET
jgi:hypothetical protein